MLDRYELLQTVTTGIVGSSREVDMAKSPSGMFRRFWAMRRSVHSLGRRTSTTTGAAPCFIWARRSWGETKVTVV